MSKNVEVEIIMLSDKVPFPMRATSGSAGFDIQAATDIVVTVYPGACVKIPLGFKMSINNPNIVALLLPKSGTGLNGIGLKNFVGVIDSDYQGQVCALVWNTNEAEGAEIVIKPGDFIGQMLFVPVVLVDFKPVTEFSEKTFRGENGFGSGVLEFSQDLLGR